MTTSVETEVQTTQVYQLFIKASPERVWEAITNPELIARYFYGAMFDGAPVVGGRWRAWTLDHSQVLNDGEIYELDPPRRFVHGWKALYDPELAVEEESRITWEIEPQEGGYSKLTVVHDRLEGAQDRCPCRGRLDADPQRPEDARRDRRADRRLRVLLTSSERVSDTVVSDTLCGRNALGTARP